MQLLDYESTFRSLPARLLNSLKNNSIGHSYIFHGDSIDDIRAFADEWVRTCTCLNLQERGACGECRHCKLHESGNYPELYRVEPESKARFITADSVRLFQNRFYLKAAAGVIKVGLLIEADRMNAQAQNVFLKTLEEPPPGTLLILMTTRSDALLNTIKSRCRLVSLAANRVQYDIDLSKRVEQYLSILQGRDGAGKALKVVDAFKEIFSGLKKKAQSEIESSYTILDQENEEPSLKKKFKDKLSALTEGRYKMYREQIISMIEVWIAQNYLKINGVDDSQMSYPEFSSREWNYDSQTAYKTLQLTEELKRDLISNVSEELALENFFLQICEK